MEANLGDVSSKDFKVPALRIRNSQNNSEGSQHSQEEEWMATQEFVGKEEIPQHEEKPATKPWGRLLSQDARYGHVDLISPEFFVGRRKECQVTFNDLRISAKHFKIYRVQNDSQQLDTFLEDLSSNGTFLNGQKLGKGNKSILKHGDEISLVAKRVAKDCIMSYVFQDLSNGEVPIDDLGEISKFYDVQKVIGTGSFSVVKMGVNRKTGERVAVKIIDKKKYWNTKNLEQLEREIGILKQIEHENIVRVIDLFSTDRYIYLVLEMASGGELFQHIAEKGSFTEEESREIFTQVLKAVEYLHGRQIAHRDLKPENILFSKKGVNQIKITDFGLARIVPEREMMTTLCGTPQYVAPEIIKQSAWTPEELKARGGYGKEVDMWSLGAILYVMLSGVAPFDEDREISLYDQIEKGLYTFPSEIFEDVSEEAKDIVRKLLCVDPRDRITVHTALEHPWILGVSTKPLNLKQGVKENVKKRGPRRGPPLSPIKIPSVHSNSDTEDEQEKKTEEKGRKRTQDQIEKGSAESESEEGSEDSLKRRRVTKKLEFES